jgi:hypothetical protein
LALWTLLRTFLILWVQQRWTGMPGQTTGRAATRATGYWAINAMMQA